MADLPLPPTSLEVAFLEVASLEVASLEVHGFTQSRLTTLSSHLSSPSAARRIAALGTLASGASNHLWYHDNISTATFLALPQLVAVAGEDGEAAELAYEFLVLCGLAALPAGLLPLLVESIRDSPDNTRAYEVLLLPEVVPEDPELLSILVGALPEMRFDKTQGHFSLHSRGESSFDCKLLCVLIARDPRAAYGSGDLPASLAAAVEEARGSERRRPHVLSIMTAVVRDAQNLADLLASPPILGFVTSLFRTPELNSSNAYWRYYYNWGEHPMRAAFNALLVPVEAQQVGSRTNLADLAAPGGYLRQERVVKGWLRRDPDSIILGRGVSALDAAESAGASDGVQELLGDMLDCYAQRQSLTHRVGYSPAEAAEATHRRATVLCCFEHMVPDEGKAKRRRVRSIRGGVLSPILSIVSYNTCTDIWSHILEYAF
ncbi:hypothetical protein TeGR_g10791 [Tetraparma gracilis]|uniref:Uncharacterized protein n=1 Tax=Tetraparma gracilis TaxID=2962635 RepID=A0ABQ6MZJ2_9STRA|nr:hypothetical protein TeGR_g10791 [Tetraparma gracilis]